MKRYFNDFKRCFTPLLEKDLNGKRGILSHNADRVVCVVGYEGMGKSNCGLELYETWGEVNSRKVTEADIKFIASDPQTLGAAVRDAKKTDMIVIDEGALMSYSRQGMTKSNTTVNQFLMTCRAEGFYIVIMIPNILDLDAYIRKTRISALIVMLPGYRCAYYSRKRCRQLIAKLSFMSKNNLFPDPSHTRIKPNFVCKVPYYDGVLREPYDKRKSDSMKKVREMLYNQFDTDAPGKKKKSILTLKQQKVKEYLDSGFEQQEVARLMGVSQAAISYTAKRIRTLTQTETET